MQNLLLILVFLAVCAYAAKSIAFKIKHGSSCCGEHEASEKKVKVKDKNKSHYAHAYRLSVDGMHCANCARRVENALNALSGVWAKADLSKKEVLLRSKTPQESGILEKAVSLAGYTVLFVQDANLK